MVNKMVGNKKERRRHKRYGVKDCTVQYKLVPLLGLEFLINISERYLVLDIAHGGVHFITKEKFKERARVLLSIKAPLLKDEIIRVRSRVVWTRKSTDSNAYHIGVEFVSMGKSDRNRLRMLLDNAVLDKIDLSTRIYLKEVERL